MSHKPDPDPKAAPPKAAPQSSADSDLRGVMDAAKSEPVPEQITRLAEQLTAAIKAKPSDRKDP